jgi:H+/Cl- antiporter ClcA
MTESKKTKPTSSQDRLWNYLKTHELWDTRVGEFLRAPHRTQAVVLWIAAVSVGLSAVAYAAVFKRTENWLHSVHEQYPYAPFILSPALFTAAWLLVKYLAPSASGSGIPQIMAANEMNYEGETRPVIDSLLSMKAAAVKILSSLLCLAGGGAIGREGPTLQISASIFHFFGRQLRRVYPNIDEQTFIIAGAAAGLASAFNTPLGGIVYAIEEMGSHHFHKVRTALLSAVIISGLMAQWMLGSYLYLGLPKIDPAGAEFVPAALLCGAISGLLGACFGWTLYELVRRRWQLKSTGKQLILTVCCGLIMASMIHFDNRAAGTGVEVITGFLFKGEPSSYALVALRYFGTTVSYLSGAAGGIFSPSLAVGASIGSCISTLIHSENQNLMVLLGMIGFLTGVTRTPFTSFILVIEMTDRHAAILPMMIAALIAQACASLISKKGFYELVRDRYLIRSQSHA